MPNYDYVCTKCGTVCTRQVPIAERNGQWCSCGYMMLRQPSAPSIQFKGSGFYVTDYKRKADKA